MDNSYFTHLYSGRLLPDLFKTTHTYGIIIPLYYFPLHYYMLVNHKYVFLFLDTDTHLLIDVRSSSTPSTLAVDSVAVGAGSAGGGATKSFKNTVTIPSSSASVSVVEAIMGLDVPSSTNVENLLRTKAPAEIS